MALYYVATVVLRMSERAFWRCTLRKLCALYRHHIERQEALWGAAPTGMKHQ